MRDMLGDLADRSPLDPLTRESGAGRRDLPRRFYSTVSVEPADGAHAVLLDGKPARTPGGRPLRLPTHALGGLVAEEFARQTERLDLPAMPVLRLANTALDGVAASLPAVLDDVIRYAGTDLVCYRAEGPARLAERQQDAWDGPLRDVEGLIGGRFLLAAGIVHRAQPEATLAAFAERVRAVTDPFAATALHTMTSITGSAILALAVLEGRLDAGAAFAACCVDEDWNIEQWGADAEAMAARANRRRDMEAAGAMVAALRQP